MAQVTQYTSSRGGGGACRTGRCKGQGVGGGGRRCHDVGVRVRESSLRERPCRYASDPPVDVRFQGLRKTGSGQTGNITMYEGNTMY
jgi:hypothetical protein